LFFAHLIEGDFTMNTAKFLTRCAFSLAVIAVFAISTADAQQRRQERRPDSNPNRTNVHCELNFWDARSARDIQEALDEAYQYCRGGDTLVLGSSALVARLCDFGWTIASIGQDVVVCVYGGRREVR
jgi:hypothetical protein